MMVLYTNKDRLFFVSVACRNGWKRLIGMQVHKRWLPGNTEQTARNAYSIFEGAQGLVIFHVADVMADKA